MRLFVELFVDNVEVSRDFYRKVFGMKLIKDGPGQVELAHDALQLNICPKRALFGPHYLAWGVDYRLGSRVEFCFEVDDIESSYRRARDHGVDIVEAIQHRPWNKRDFRLIDPDGAYIRVTTPVLE